MHISSLKFCLCYYCRRIFFILIRHWCVSAEEYIDKPSVFLLPHVLAGLGRIISGCRPYRLPQRIYSQVSANNPFVPDVVFLTNFNYRPEIELEKLVFRLFTYPDRSLCINVGKMFSNKHPFATTVLKCKLLQLLHKSTLWIHFI